MQALGLELTYGVEPVISLESYNYLEPYFKNIRYRVGERDICGYKEYYRAFLDHLDEMILEVGLNAHFWSEGIDKWLKCRAPVLKVCSSNPAMTWYPLIDKLVLQALS